MQTGRRQPPSEREVAKVLFEQFIGPSFAQPDWLDGEHVDDAMPVLGLECLGGPSRPPTPRDADRPELKRRVERLLRLIEQLAPRFRQLSETELKSWLFEEELPAVVHSRAGKSEGELLEEAAKELFQVESGLDPLLGITDLMRTLNAKWGKKETGKWFLLNRRPFICMTLARWIVETEDRYRATHRPPIESESESPTPGASHGPAESTQKDKNSSTLQTDRQLLSQSVTDVLRKANPLLVASITLALVGLAVVAIVASPDAVNHNAQNPAGELGQLIPTPLPDDITVADDSVWVASSKTKTAIRIDARNGTRKEFGVNQSAQFKKFLSRYRRPGDFLGGYHIAAGAFRAWVVSSNSTLTALNPNDGTAVEIARLKVDTGDVAFTRGSLWIGGGTHELFKLDASSGRTEASVDLGRSLGVEKLTADFRGVWGLGFDQSTIWTVNSFAPESLQEIALDRRALDIAIGRFGLWTANRDGTVGLYDTSTGELETLLHIPGSARLVAAGGRHSVWVSTDDQTVVHIHPGTQTQLGQPIKLPGKAVAIAANGKSCWVATDHGLVEVRPIR